MRLLSAYRLSHEAEEQKAKQEFEAAGASENFMHLRSRSARAANSMVLLLQEKAKSANGEIGPEEFHEGLLELGVCKPNEDTSALFNSLDTVSSPILHPSSTPPPPLLSSSTPPELHVIAVVTTCDGGGAHPIASSYDPLGAP